MPRHLSLAFFKLFCQILSGGLQLHFEIFHRLSHGQHLVEFHLRLLQALQHLTRLGCCQALHGSFQGLAREPHLGCLLCQLIELIPHGLFGGRVHGTLFGGGCRQALGHGLQFLLKGFQLVFETFLCPQIFFHVLNLLLHLRGLRRTQAARRAPGGLLHAFDGWVFPPALHFFLHIFAHRSDLLEGVLSV